MKQCNDNDCKARIEALERRFDIILAKSGLGKAHVDGLEFQEIMDHTARTRDFKRLNAYLTRINGAKGEKIHAL